MLTTTLRPQLSDRSHHCDRRRSCLYHTPILTVKLRTGFSFREVLFLASVTSANSPRSARPLSGPFPRSFSPSADAGSGVRGQPDAPRLCGAAWSARRTGSSMASLSQPAPEPYRIFWLGLSAIVGLVIGDTFLFQCYVLVGARIGVLMFVLGPPFGALLSWIFLGETMAPSNSWRWSSSWRVCCGSCWSAAGGLDAGRPLAATSGLASFSACSPSYASKPTSSCRSKGWQGVTPRCPAS